MQPRTLGEELFRSMDLFKVRCIKGVFPDREYLWQSSVVRLYRVHVAVILPLSYPFPAVLDAFPDGRATPRISIVNFCPAR